MAHHPGVGSGRGPAAEAARAVNVNESVRVRRWRRDQKVLIKSGELGILALLDRGESEQYNWRLHDLLRAKFGWNTERVRGMLKAMEIPWERKIGHLTRDERTRLFNTLGK